MSNKTYGLRKERELKKKFEEQGWFVIPSKGSFGPFDGIAINRYGVKLFQCKATRLQKKPSYGPEIKEIRAFNEVPPNATKELWYWWKKERHRITI